MNSRGQKMDPFQSLYYVSPACLLCLAFPFAAAELPGVLRLFRDPTWALRPSVFAANAATALALNLAVFMLIGKTSALTMNIAGVIKDWTLIYSSYSVFKAPVTALNLTGARPVYACTCAAAVIARHRSARGAARHPGGPPGHSAGERAFLREVMCSCGNAAPTPAERAICWAAQQFACRAVSGARAPAGYVF